MKGQEIVCPPGVEKCLGKHQHGGIRGPFILPINKFYQKIKCIYLIYYYYLAALGLHWCARAFSSCGERELPRRGAQASHCCGFFCCTARALGEQVLVVAVQEGGPLPGLETGFLSNTRK